MLKKNILHKNPLSSLNTIMEACQNSVLQQTAFCSLWNKGVTQDFAQTALLMWFHS